MAMPPQPTHGDTFLATIETYARVLDVLPVGAAVFDEALTIRYLNPRAAEIASGGLGAGLGRSLSELTAEVYGVERSAGLVCLFNRILGEGISHHQRGWTLADRRVAPEDREIDWEAHRILTSDGTRAILMILVDLREQHRRQRQSLARVRRLEELETRFRQTTEELQRRVTELNTILDLVPVGIGIAHDPDCRLISGNRAMRRLLRIEGEDENLSLSSPIVGDLGFTIHRDGREIPPNDLPMQMAARGVSVPPTELRVVFDDGTFADEMVAAVPLLDAAGKPRGSVAALVDLTPIKQVESELHRSQRRLRLAEEVASSGVYEWDLLSGRSVWSRGHEALFGLADGAFDGTYDRWMHCIDAGDRARVSTRLRESVTLRTLFDEEFRIQRPDGTERWVRSTGRVVDQLDGGGPGFIGVSTDITSRKLAEERLAMVCDTIGLGMWMCDLPLGRLDWNRHVKEHFGLAPEAEVDYDRFLACLHPEDRERTRQAIDEAVQRQQPYDIEYRTVDGDGRVRWIHAMGRTFADADGVPRRFDGITIDITERKRQDEEARQTAERLAAAIAAAEAGTFRWDIRTDVLHWDAGMQALFGLPEGTTVRTLAGFLALVHPEDRADVIERCRRCAEQSADFESEFRIVRPDGAVRWIFDKGRTFLDSQGRPASMTGACVDVTVRHATSDG